MSANTDEINRAFDKIKKAGIRFDVPKYELPEEIQEEIEKYSKGDISLKPKTIRDLEEYKEKLYSKREILKKKLEDKPMISEQFMPKPESIEKLPSNILKDRQKVYLKNTNSLKVCLGETREITPYSSDSTYDNLRSTIKNTWLNSGYNDGEVLQSYKDGKFYPDATYITLSADRKLQGLVNIEIQDNEFWVRDLNSAPWNQGESPQLMGVGSALMARAMSLCLETGNKNLKLAPNNETSSEFYKKMGFEESGIKEFGGIDYIIWNIDEAGMKKYLDEYERFLSN